MSSTLTPNANEFASASAGLALVCSDPAFGRADLLGEPITLGSGPRCSLRLRGSGLRPLHCVVTPTEAGPVVRRWASETLLNGQEFTESTLTAGDRLTVGGIDFSVVGPSQAEAAEEVLASPAVEVVPESTSSVEEPVESQPEPALEIADDSQAFEAIEEIQAEVDALVESPLEADPWSEAGDQTDPFGFAETVAPVSVETPADEPAANADAADAFAAEVIPVADTADVFQAAASEQDNAAPSPSVESPFGESTLEAPGEDLWGFAPQPEAANTQPPVAEENSSPAAADMWQSEFEPPAAAADLPGSEEPEAPTAEAIEAFSSETSSEVTPEVEGFALEELTNVVEAAEQNVADEAPASWRGRLIAGRQRVRRLTQSLRECRERITTLENEAADRTAAIAALETRVTEVVEAAESATQRLSQVDEGADQLAEAEQTLAEANARIAELEQQLADFEQAAVPEEPVDETALAVEHEPFGTEPEVEPEVEGVVEEVTSSQPVRVEIDEEELAGVWGDVGVASPAAETPVELEPADSGLAPIESDEPQEPVAEGNLWGIEQLADPTPVAWPAIETGLANEEPAPVEAEAAPHESEPTPQDGVVDAPVGLEEPAPEEPQATPEPLAAFQPPAENAADGPVGEESFISKYAHLLPDDDAPAEPVAPVEPVASLEEEPEAGEASGEGDDSIDDYMRRLMERVRGGDSSPAESEAYSQPAGNQATAPQVPVDEPEPAAEPEPAELIKDLSELKRGPAVEPAADLGALRKLANQSARNALDAAATKESRERATLRLTASAVTFGCGLMAAVASTSAFNLQFAGGLLAAGAGGWFGFRTLRGYATKNPAQHLIDSQAD